MAFSGPVCTNAYGPHTGLSSMVLQRKCLQGRTGHMIKYVTYNYHISTPILKINVIFFLITRLIVTKNHNIMVFLNSQRSPYL